MSDFATKPVIHNQRDSVRSSFSGRPERAHFRRSKSAPPGRPLNEDGQTISAGKCFRDRIVRRGFTLIEILTVVVILAILAAIALPSLATQNDLTLSAASRVVVADLLYAQSQAVATGQNQTVSFTVASNQPGGGDGSYSVSSPGPITRAPYTQTFGSGLSTPLANVALAEVTFDDSANTVLAFSPLGAPMASPVNGTPVSLISTGTIVLQCGSEIVTLSIEPDTGNITVSSVQEQ